MHHNDRRKKKRSTFTDEGDGNGRQVNHGQYTNGTADSNSGSSFLQLLFVRVEKERGQEGDQCIS